MTIAREWISRGAVAFALVTTVALPFALRKDQAPALRAEQTVVIITPHNEAIRSEFGRAFSQWQQRRTGRVVGVDWRVIGGTSEITRYLEGEYTASFRLHWTRELGRPWTEVVQQAFANPSVKLDGTPDDDTVAQAARRAFLASNVGCGIDVFFGGGSYDFMLQATAGRLTDSGVAARHPEWFHDRVIPREVNGEPFWAADHAWIGAVVSSFGILYNHDSLRRLGIAEPPDDWRDLTDVRYFGELALADPTKSSSIAKAFEMVLQREMQVLERQLRSEGMVAADAEYQAVREGWRRGMAILQLMGANARYFTDSSQKPPIDVGQGESAAGMCIDFYGRFQAGTAERRDGRTRLTFVTPPSGSVYSVDPIATLRGAPSGELATDFIEFVLSPEGQDLWNFRAGEPGGPSVFALRRLPVRKDSYTPDKRARMSDPDVNPFSEENDFRYHASWTGGLLRELSFVMRIMCIDTHEELADAWREVIAAGQPTDALAVLQDLSAIDYDATLEKIRPIIRSGRAIDEVRLGQELAAKFRAQYARAAEIARAGR
jgi:iron(III) transport system substrate-binding protein